MKASYTMTNTTRTIGCLNKNACFNLIVDNGTVNTAYTFIITGRDANDNIRCTKLVKGVMTQRYTFDAGMAVSIRKYV